MQEINSIGIEIAGIRVRFSGITDECRKVMEKRYGAFLSGEHDYEWTLNWTEKDNPALTWDVTMETREDCWLFYRRDFCAEWCPSTGKGCAVVDASEYTLDTMLRVWFSTMLLDNNGGLVHSAGFARNDKGYLFIGKSGSGKSTLSGARGDSDLLSDELVAVKKMADGYQVFGTPFMGELGIGGKNVGVPLDRFFIVNHEPPAGRFPVNQAEAASELWGTMMCFDRRSNRLKSIMDFCTDMATALSCERFSFDLTQNLWDWMEQ